MIQILDRLGRPLFIRILMPLAIVWFMWEVAMRVLRAMDRAIETGSPVPDMTAGLGPIVIAIGVPVLNLLVDQITRHRERMDQQARGTAPGPFGQTSAAPSLPNDLEGPRPWQNRE